MKGVIKMDWKELMNLEEEVEEWIDFLMEKGRENGLPIWGKLNTRKILKLTEERLNELQEKIKLFENGADKKAIEKNIIELTADLIRLRKEYQR